ncbi:hypothetical protein [Microcella alkalica]|uniref:Uncharacterized protein n=1 Tax=Microcella alkalica TaxID=355930 RepID=A0A839EAY2_9MICO|nr:hypothetical protein [Microcella alkalica]MBA8848386.1 hypothetical protein [Microcella alkalica]
MSRAELYSHWPYQHSRSVVAGSISFTVMTRLPSPSSAALSVESV